MYSKLLEETVEAVTPVPRKRVQQGTAKQTEDLPQFLEQTVEVVNTTLQERISETSEAIKVPKISDTRPPGGAKYRATAKSVLTESSCEFSLVAESVGKVRPAVFPDVAKSVGWEVPDQGWSFTTWRNNVVKK